MGTKLQNNKIDKEAEEMAGEQETSWNRQMLKNPYFSNKWEKKQTDRSRAI